MKFARRAIWLTNLFTPSERPTTRFPDSYGDDVSLVQPYDGGGVPIPAREGTIFQVDSVVGTDSITNVLTTGPDQVARIYSIQGSLQAGANCTIVGILGNESGNFVGITPRFTTVDTNKSPLEVFATVIPPNHTISGELFGGDVLTKVRWRVLALVVPSGTVFYA